jgi:hypothetical protein
MTRVKKTALPPPTEAVLWSHQRPQASAALDFVIGFLGCRMGRNRDQPLDANARARLLTLVRAVSVVESRHGTAGNNQPARDPLQAGNPADAWWREFTGPSGTGSRFIRGPGLTNLYAGDLGDAAETSTGFPAAARRGLLSALRRGHQDAGFSAAHSYVWGIMYLIHRVNSAAGDPTFACGSLGRERLLAGVVTYNGGGVPDYRQRLEAALREIGDPLPVAGPEDDLDQADAVAQWLDAARAVNQPIRKVEVRFDTVSGRPALVTIEYFDEPAEGA